MWNSGILHSGRPFMANLRYYEGSWGYSRGELRLESFFFFSAPISRQDRLAVVPEEILDKVGMTPLNIWLPLLRR
jgi:hypothetical protein